MDDWTDLDDDYLEIFGEHPALSAATSSVPAMDNEKAADEQPALSDRDLAMLDLERSWWKYAGAKESAVRDRFDMSSTRYYQVLNTLIDRPEALAYDPMLVRRLIRLRTARQQQRAAVNRTFV